MTNIPSEGLQGRLWGTLEGAIKDEKIQQPGVKAVRKEEIRGIAGLWTRITSKLVDVSGEPYYVNKRSLLKFVERNKDSLGFAQDK